MARKITTNEFIERAKLIHSDKYDYSLSEYIRNDIKTNIICNIHGTFEQRPNNHLNGQGCPLCKNMINGLKMKSTEQFIKEVELIHGNRYDYSNVEYNGAYVKIKIICTEHGIFYQSPIHHINGCGCKKCTLGLVHYNNRKSLTEFIENAKLKHGDKYDYSFSNYEKSNIKIKINCSEHGEFMQRPADHLKGNGCPKCNTIGNVMEPKLYNKLKNYFNSQIIKSQGKPNWLGLQSLDIYFPEFNIAIEYQGDQHFKSIDFFGGDESYENIKSLDERKYKLCLENNCKLIYFTYNVKHIPINYLDTVLSNELELIDLINLELKKRL